ncbi:MAG TPA: glycosyltransferase [Kiritimatiellia bacterium]|nr:glycosyltransferase [Kiritimatiellia bacterium]
MNAMPRVTLAFLSWNRLHYLRATLESARECIRYPNLEWIVSDNESIEPGLREYVESRDWIQHKWFKRQSHAAAMNEMMERATGDFILIWPEDVQFTVRGDWMIDLVELLTEHQWLGSICLDYMRGATREAIFHPNPLEQRHRFIDECLRYKGAFRRSRIVRSSRGFALRSFGWPKQGVCGSGIPSLTRSAVWRELGPWRTSDGPSRFIDSSLGAEDDMVMRFYESRRPLQGAIPLIPVAADLITDPTGCKAKVRGHYRYGVYMPPPEGTFYYRIRDLAEFTERADGLPLSFAEGVEPLGFRIPVDERGDRLKSQMNMSVVYDIQANQPVPYPLTVEPKR